MTSIQFIGASLRGGEDRQERGREGRGGEGRRGQEWGREGDGEGVTAKNKANP